MNIGSGRVNVPFRGDVVIHCRSYVSLRILGMAADHEVASSARAWVRWHGCYVLLPYCLLA